MPLSELVDELDGKPVAEVARSLSDRQKIRKIAEGQLLIEERECRVL
jgi:hypothetical protein